MSTEKDSPKLDVDVHRKTSQLNVAMVVAVLLFFVIAGVWVYRVFRDPPQSTPDMQQGGLRGKAVWYSRLC